MRMRSLAALAVFGLMAAPGQADDDVVRTLALTGFEEVRLSGSMDLTIRVGERFEVVVEGDRDRVDALETKVKDGVLYLSERRRRGGGGWFSGGDLDLAIAMPVLTGVAVSGSGDVQAHGIESDSFAAAISGSGDMDLSGRCGRLKIAVSGSGDVSAAGLTCRDADISIAGSGDAEVHATREVSVRVSGSGDVDIYGGGRITSSKISGSSDLTLHSNR